MTRDKVATRIAENLHQWLVLEKRASVGFSDLQTRIESVLEQLEVRADAVSSKCEKNSQSLDLHPWPQQEPGIDY